MMKKMGGVILFFIFFPNLVQASVMINEVAWMGSTESANHEWIELYNSGDEAVDVSGWTLRDAANLNINLTGIIPAYSYVVLERTSENSAPGPAFLIYTGALVNTGATLTLQNENDSIIDQVFGGENWSEIGGDNITKETAQYTEAGWVTDIPTPGSQNRSGRIEVEVEEKSSSAQGQDTKTTTEKTAIVISKENAVNSPPLTLTINAPEITFVNQKTTFSVVTKNTQNIKSKSLIYEWNFGDSYTGGGRERSHVFSYPGSYIVTVSTWAEGSEIIERREVKVLPVNFSLTKNETGDIQINNDALYAVDISGYKISGSKTVTFPENSAILPKSTITIAKDRLLKKIDEFVILYDTTGKATASTWSKTSPLLEKVNTVFPEVSNKEITTNQIVFANNPESSVVKNISEESNGGEVLNKSEFGFASDKITTATGIEEIDLISVAEEFALENSEDSHEEKSEIKNPQEKDSLSFEDEEEEFGYSYADDVRDESGERWPYFALIALLILALFGLYGGKK